VVTTGQEQNGLRAFSEKAGFRLFSIPSNVGGRFSVLSPVGLFPAAMAGIDIAELLAGARLMDERCKTEDLWRNPALMSAALHFIADTRKGLDIAVVMPYSDVLSEIGFWFRQLWAESLGKARNNSGQTVNVGQTPIAAFGVTDQHSQLQLYQEGPFNKMITFLVVEGRNEKVSIPPLDGIPEFSHLQGHTLAELMNIEADATRFALTGAGRSNMSIIIPEVNAFTAGQLLFMFQMQTVFAGALYDVNALDQPGVEASKDYIYGLTGRKGYEMKASQISAWRKGDGQYVI
jgi:glucose-6-phosphate isomerase